MNGREEKLARIKAQIAKAFSENAKAVNEISHGDHSAVEVALADAQRTQADALSAMLQYLEEEVPDRTEFMPGSQEVKELQPQAEAEQKQQVREALDTLRSEPTRSKRR
jgi:hypothetical protein